MSSEDDECPLCLEEFDETDRAFDPCKCGYRICLWCWHDINDKLNGKCPACRAEYDPDLAKHMVSANAMKKHQAKKRDELRKQQNQQNNVSHPLTGAEIAAAAAASLQSTGKITDSVSRDELAAIRVLQRNLLYVVGLPASAAKEEVLRKKEYLGRFGKILKIAINKKQIHQGPSLSNVSFSAYVTFKKTSDARAAIHAINGSTLDGRAVRATYGTTKYCSYFLSRGQQCNNPQCLYLHVLADPQDCFTKDELAASDRFSPEFVGTGPAGPLVALPQAASPGSSPNNSPLTESTAAPTASIPAMSLTTPTPSMSAPTLTTSMSLPVPVNTAQRSAWGAVSKPTPAPLLSPESPAVTASQTAATAFPSLGIQPLTSTVSNTPLPAPGLTAAANSSATTIVPTVVIPTPSASTLPRPVSPAAFPTFGSIIGGKSTPAATVSTPTPTPQPQPLPQPLPSPSTLVGTVVAPAASAASAAPAPVPSEAAFPVLGSVPRKAKDVAAPASAASSLPTPKPVTAAASAPAAIPAGKPAGLFLPTPTSTPTTTTTSISAPAASATASATTTAKSALVLPTPTIPAPQPNSSFLPIPILPTPTSDAKSEKPTIPNSQASVTAAPGLQTQHTDAKATDVFSSLSAPLTAALPTGFGGLDMGMGLGMGYQYNMMGGMGMGMGIGMGVGMGNESTFNAEENTEDNVDDNNYNNGDNADDPIQWASGLLQAYHQQPLGYNGGMAMSTGMAAAMGMTTGMGGANGWGDWGHGFNMGGMGMQGYNGMNYGAGMGWGAPAWGNPENVEFGGETKAPASSETLASTDADKMYNAHGGKANVAQPPGLAPSQNPYFNDYSSANNTSSNDDNGDNNDDNTDELANYGYNPQTVDDRDALNLHLQLQNLLSGVGVNNMNSGNNNTNGWPSGGWPGYEGSQMGLKNTTNDSETARHHRTPDMPPAMSGSGLSGRSMTGNGLHQSMDHLGAQPRQYVGNDADWRGADWSGYQINAMQGYNAMGGAQGYNGMSYGGMGGWNYPQQQMNYPMPGWGMGPDANMQQMPMQQMPMQQQIMHPGYGHGMHDNRHGHNPNMHDNRHGQYGRQTHF